MIRSRSVVTLSLALLLVSGAAAAQVIRQSDDPLAALAFVDPRLRPAPAGAELDRVAGELPALVRSGWSSFLDSAGGPWKAYVDRRTGRIDYAEGAGIRWITGSHPSLQDLEGTARELLARMGPALGVDPATLVLAPERSGHPADFLWLVDFDLVRDGLPVEGARVVFRINHGNLIQFGTESLPAPGSEVPPQEVSREQALAILAGHVNLTAADSFVDSGTVRLLAVGQEQEDGQGFEPGKGRGLARVWELVFRRRGSPGTWRARIDATSGELLEFRDVDTYAKVNGGVYPKSAVFADETVRPMPYADLSTGGFTDSAGFFTPAGGPVTSTLNGKYVAISDTCGPISQGANGFGNISFGTSAGTDCATPGSGGAGNSHSSRMQFYHVNRAKEVGRGWLPFNSWLNARLTVNVDIFDTCNAYWDGGALNFFRSGGGCGNTGEIAGVSLHEYGHGLDDNDGLPIADLGTAESYADTTAVLLLHDSCMGPGFFQSGNCGGYGDACTSCSGVRDVDWAKHVSNTPHTVDNFTRQRCYSSGYSGPCGMEGHCESYIPSESVWDLANRDLPGPGSAAAWLTTERLWYLSRPTASAAFTCSTASVPWTSNGCSTGSLWRTLRAADDDDGNLANGTPNSCHLYAALNRHGIACTTDPGANVCFSGCTPPAQPAVSLTAGDRQVLVSWSTQPGAVRDVFRSEAGCDDGFVKIAGDVAGSSYNDTAVLNGATYSYRVVAHASGNAACTTAPTDCQAAMPVEAPCLSPPPAPAGLIATAMGSDRIYLYWGAVSGALEYRVFRGPSAAGPWTAITAIGAPATSFVDSGLQQGATWFYAVRAATGETCESADSSAASATTVACNTINLYTNDFETGSGLAGWTVTPLGGPGSEVDWRGIQTCTAHSGSNVFRFGSTTCSGLYLSNGYAAARPQAAAGFAVPQGAAQTRLSFWQQRDFEFGYDGGTLQLSVDGGAYAQVPGSALSGAGYDAALFNDCQPPGLEGTPVFTGHQSAFAQTVVDLDQACGGAGCGGHTLRVGFTAITDCIVQYSGWFLDDVAATSCVPPPAPATPLDFYTVTPCRLVDTRPGQPLLPGEVRDLQLTGLCTLPATARALSVNLTVVDPAANGNLILFRADQALPGTSSINFQPTATRANNAIVALSATGALRVKSSSTQPVHFVLDVNGYFQ